MSALSQPVRFYIRTLGCKMNWLDSARLGAALRGAGHIPVNDEAEADFVLVNSCTVTAEADRKSRQQAHAARRRQKRVAILGCGPRVDAAQWTTQLPDTLIFPSESALLDYFGVEGATTPAPLNTRTRLPVAIQTGCDDRCTFCITRTARGPHRSLPAEDIVGQVRHAEELGLREVVLTGINLAAWGCADTRKPQGARLGALLQDLLARTGVPRIRLSSLGPQYLNDGFFDALADPRLCAHLHLSVQSGSPGVLRRMARGHGAEEVRRAAERARAVRPDVGLAADIIAGFPAESEAEHGETLALVEELAFSKLHVFPFSAREGTPAATMADQIEPNVRKTRAAELRALGERLREAFGTAQIGTRQQVLVERNETGLTGNYLRVAIPGASENELRTVVLDATLLASPYSPASASA